LERRNKNAAGDRNRPVEVRDVASSVIERRVQFPAQAVFKRELRGGFEAVLNVQRVVPSQAVIVLVDGRVVAAVRKAEEKVAQIPSGEAPVERRVPVIVAAGKAESGLDVQAPHVAAELHGVAAEGPGGVVVPLVAVGEGKTGFAFAEAGRAAAETETRQAVEGQLGRRLESDLAGDLPAVEVIRGDGVVDRET